MHVGFPAKRQNKWRERINGKSNWIYCLISNADAVAHMANSFMERWEHQDRMKFGELIGNNKMIKT